MVHPIKTEIAPIWSLHGRWDDYSLIRHGHYFVYSDRWAYSPQFVRCLPPGGSVSYAEIGYFAFTRRDLTVIDPRGLTDKKVARSGPASTKTRAGVDTHHWFEPTSALGRILLRKRPMMILDPESPPMPAALGGEYVKVRTETFDANYTVTSYRRRDVSCS